MAKTKKVPAEVNSAAAQGGKNFDEPAQADSDRIDFNDPTLTGAEAVARNLKEQNRK